MYKAIAVFRPSCFSADIPPIPVSVPLGVSRRPVRAHLPLPVCDKKIRGLRTVALEFRTEVRLDLCRRASVLFALKFERLLTFECILSKTLQHAVAYSKMCQMTDRCSSIKYDFLRKRMLCPSLSSFNLL